MARLKAYDWEREKWPTERKINILPEYRIPLTKALCKYFGINYVDVTLHSRSGATAYPQSSRINLQNQSRDCSLGTIYHEVSHLLNYKNGGHGHTGTFKHYLIKVYVEGKSQLKRIFSEIKAERARVQDEYAKQAERTDNRNKAILRQKEFRKTDEFKIKNLQDRIKHLESRKKRIETILKKANRQLIRLHKKDVTKKMEVIINHD